MSKKELSTEEKIRSLPMPPFEDDFLHLEEIEYGNSEDRGFVLDIYEDLLFLNWITYNDGAAVGSDYYHLYDIHTLEEACLELGFNFFYLFDDKTCSKIYLSNKIPKREMECIGKINKARNQYINKNKARNQYINKNYEEST